MHTFPTARLLALGAAILFGCAAHAAAPDAEHPSVKRPYSLPPSADLTYTIKARQHGLSIGGTATVQWRAADGKYLVATESRAALFGKILENRSEGLVDDYGLAPATFYEKRFRKDPSNTVFKRDVKTIAFSEGDESYPLKGGEQDRTSIQWQLAAQARAAPDKFKPGSEWNYFVAGRRDAEVWSFKVVKSEVVQVGAGEVNAVHLVKAPPPDAQGQQVDLWLAPTMDWYPVRVRFNDNDGDFVDQTLEKAVKK
ncbi:DUF3108 domain-containing protein [Duganella sp. HH101]|uniref:DUF3108 domain-containing protein n=1 Tax=Duganella sp. HH101 TaxID=1781066 RepID=UPI000874ED7D|nr:DUF3108 domain-containing protein [Duganella sp. HH101]OFA00478.1 hypothetical protein DUGA2_46620 [Duganella sp. HH101]